MAEVINARDNTNWSGYDDQASTRVEYQRIVELYKLSRRVFESDETVIKNGTLNTTSGALFTGGRIMAEIM